MQLQRENMKLSRNLRGIVKAVDMTLKSFEAENKKSLHQLAEEVSKLIIKSGEGNQMAIKSLSDDISRFKQMLVAAAKAPMMGAEDEN